MNRKNRYAPTLDRLERREPLSGPGPLDPVPLPPGGTLNPTIIQPVPAPTPHLPPGTVIA